MKPMYLAAVVLLAVISAGISNGSAQAHSTISHSGDGTVQHSRLPFLENASIELSQGWGGQTSHTGSVYYGSDWANHGSTFMIYVVTEGDATCTVNDPSWGNYVIVDRINSPYFDRYAHLPSCPFTSQHLEQGDALSFAGATGNVTGVHLHYQKETSGGSSVSGPLSGWTSFDDGLYGDGPPNCGSSPNDCHAFVSDNAGPGVNPSSLSAWIYIRAWYVNLGHLICAGEAWDCFGSSVSSLGEGMQATRSCLGASSDCGWNQDFSQDSKFHNFAWPEQCTKAYWVLDGYYLTWLSNTWLGQARNSLFYWAGYYWQTFRHGYMLAPTVEGPYTILSADVPQCGT